jgi:hypothetical protein
MNVSTFRTTLRTNYLARAAVSNLGAKFFRYPPGKSATNVPTLFLTNVASVAQVHHTLGGGTERVWLVEGAGYAPATGITDTQWANAEGNARTLIGELTDELSEDPEQSIPGIHAHVSDWSMTPTHDEDTNRDYFSIQFSITVQDFTG